MKRLLIYAILLVLGGFLWWAFSPLLFDKEVQDELDPTLKARLETQKQVDQNREGNVDNINLSKTDEPTDEEGVSVVDETPVFSDGPFPITGTPGHPAKGEVSVIRSPEETLIRYQNYDGTNGPDLYVYLSKDLEAKEFIDLGEAKGNKGNIIYGVPLDVNLDEYPYVLTWCKAFGVLFDYARIN
jgi:hypothetical protein